MGNNRVGIPDTIAIESPLMVSIKCLTFNHANYIRQALDGFVMQKTNFKFEAIVHDDCSTDGTTDIIREYAEKYPDIIIPIYEKENLFSKHDGSLDRTVDMHLRGKYIAFCEGDDYWTDPLKLQKQVDFLESNPDYSMVFHKIRVHQDINNVHKEYLLANISEREYSPTEIFESMLFQTASVVVKKEIFEREDYLEAKNSNMFKSGDILIYLAASNNGRVYGLADEMSVYRIHGGGMTVEMKKDPFEFIRENNLFPKYFGEKYYKSAKAKNVKGYLRTTAIGFKTLNVKIICKSLYGFCKNIRYIKIRPLVISIKKNLHI